MERKTHAPGGAREPHAGNRCVYQYIYIYIHISNMIYFILLYYFVLYYSIVYYIILYYLFIYIYILYTASFCLTILQELPQL